MIYGKLLLSGAQRRCSHRQTGMFVSVSFEMFDEGCLGHVDGQLADVGHIITNTLQMFGDKQQARISCRSGWLSYHHFNQAMENMVIEIVNLSIPLNNLAGRRGVVGSES